jgi:hypothetical protein
MSFSVSFVHCRVLLHVNCKLHSLLRPVMIVPNRDMCQMWRRIESPSLGILLRRANGVNRVRHQRSRLHLIVTHPVRADSRGLSWVLLCNKAASCSNI